jgi:hypothetical protein
MPRGLLIVLAAALVIGVALVEGLRSNRWGESEDLKAAAAKLERVPREFGVWNGSDTTLDPKLVEKAEAVGYVSRQYVNRKNGERIEVLLLCGPSGPIGAHTPDVCYGGLGYKCIGKPIPRRVDFANASATFWTGRFEKQSPTDNPLRVYWAWGVNGEWQASDNPRTDFAFRGALFKLYVVHQEKSGTEALANEFLTEFLPLVKHALTADTALPASPD